MQGLEPRTLAIEVEDKRPVSAEDRKVTERNVTQALAEVFGREGIEVAAKSPHLLSIRLERPSSGLKNTDPESCVEMLGQLKLGDGRSMAAKSVGCAELENALGMSYGGNVSAAFQYAASTLLKYLDEVYVVASSPLVFERKKIEVPPFPEVGVAALQLMVKDSYSADGSLGRNLTDELHAAFGGAGVNVDQGAGQQMTVTLSHPSEDLAGRAKATCMAIEVEARLKRGTAFGRGTACRGVAETAHHEVLSDALKALWTEYARLIGK